MNYFKHYILQVLKALKMIGIFMPFVLIFMFFLCFSVVPAAAQQEAIRFQRAYEVIDQFIEQYMREAKTPGLALGLTTREGLLRVSTYGFADIKAMIPVTPETLFEIGSITKSFTAIALMQLHDEGKFDPNAPVIRYLPWFSVKTKYEPITCHHLLSHTAGIPANRDDIPASLYMPWALRYQSTAYAPGKRFYYSNIGYQTLSFLLEDLCGESYSDIIRKRIFLPLSMDSSEAAITHETRKRLAVGYQFLYDDRPFHPSHPIVEATWLEYDVGDGCIASNPKDMAAYMRMLLNRGKGPKGRILSEKSFKTFSSPAVKEMDNEYYGYGIGMGKVNGNNCLMHGGGMVGYTSYLICDLDDGLGVIVFVNGPGDTYHVAMFALKALQATLHKQKMPNIPKPKTPTKVENATDYSGTYTTPEGKRLLLAAEGERLVLLHKKQKIVLERRRKDEFFVNHPDFALFLLRFARHKEKVVEAAYGSDWYTNDDYSGPHSFKYPESWEAYPGHYRTQDPWFNNFRILLRKGKLILATSDAAESSEGEEILIEIEPGLFKIGEEETAERIRFDTIVNGKALRVNYSGVDFYRVSTP